MGTTKLLAGPVALGTSAANVAQGGGGSALIHDVVKQVRVTNKGSVDATFSLYLGATGASAAGTELAKNQVVKAGTSADIFFTGLKVVSTQYLVGLSDTATALTITVLGEQHVV